MPWKENAKAIVEAYLSGQAGGSALWDVLFGDVNPSGKLAETFPLHIEDVASTPYFPMGPKAVEYRESIYVGYRFFDKAKVDVLFPFGFGLSYTQFEYSQVTLDKEKMTDKDLLTVHVEVKNTGSVFGKEIVQLYVHDRESTLFRPEKELKGFEKVALQPNETKTVSFTLDKRSFAYYNIYLKDWHVESGEFEILVGASSADIRFNKLVSIEGTVPFNEKLNDKREELSVYYELKPSWRVSKEDFEKLYGKRIVHEALGQKGTFHRNSTMKEISTTFIGRILYKRVLTEVNKMFGTENENSAGMVQAMVGDMPLRAFAMMSGGRFNMKQIDGLITILNGRLLKGLRMMR